MNVTAIIRRTSIVAVLAVASVFAAGPVFADGYTTVKIYHTTSKPLALIHAVDSYFPRYAGHRDYRDYDKHREYGKYRGNGKHRGHNKHDNYRGHALWAIPSQSYHGYRAPTRGSWSSGGHREKVRYNRHGRDSDSYRRTERSSVIIRQRSR